MAEVPLKMVITRAGEVVETRRVRLVSPTFNAINRVVQQWTVVKYDLLYNDEDGESITVGSEEEWEECLRVWVQIGTAILVLKVHLSVDELVEASDQRESSSDAAIEEKADAHEAEIVAEPARADDPVHDKHENIQVAVGPAVVVSQAEAEQSRDETKPRNATDDASAQGGSDVAKGKKLKKRVSKVQKKPKQAGTSKADKESFLLQEIVTKERETAEEDPVVPEQPMEEVKLEPLCKTCTKSLPGPLAIQCCSQCTRSGGVDHGPWCKHNPSRASVISKNRASTRSATVPNAAPSGNDPKTLYSAQIKRLENMGFPISDKVIGLLVQNEGSLAAVVERILV
ncbi:hypothetical protein DIPPA_00763 [Diplonema papillatum]|nr:hypothetical protein DIPPA_00763 [Diplonema papillatum]